MTKILGIVNLTRDSFSDGGRFLDPSAAIAHARQLLADGADVVDLGAESTHPQAERVPAALEIERLTPVVEVLKRDGAIVSIDTCKAEVMRRMIELGADIINDVTALADPRSRAVLRAAGARVVIMHAVRPDDVERDDGRARGGRVAAVHILAHALSFFREHIRELEAAGIERERLILDPGMGFFVGDTPDASLALLRGISALRAIGCPVLVSTSRKSFIGALLSRAGAPSRPVDQRAAGTLASELWAAHQGAEFIRTHDVKALRDALAVWSAMQKG